MKRTLMALFLVLAATPVWASSLTVVSSTSGAGWQPFGSVQQNGARYWDNPSWDSSACNVGNVLTGTQTCGPTIPGGGVNPANLQWWGLANGDADPNFLLSFLLAGAGRLRGGDLFSASGLAGVDDFGWFDPNSSARRTLFNALSHIGDSIDEDTPLLFGLYLNNGSGEYRTSAGGRQQFALFRDVSTSTFYIAAEDLPNAFFSSSDYDYNDRIISIQAIATTDNPVPEPGSLVLLGTGLFGSVWLVRRRKASGGGVNARG